MVMYPEMSHFPPPYRNLPVKVGGYSIQHQGTPFARSFAAGRSPSVDIAQASVHPARRALCHRRRLAPVMHVRGGDDRQDFIRMPSPPFLFDSQPLDVSAQVFQAKLLWTGPQS